jgi:hypothetical protein
MHRHRSTAEHFKSRRRRRRVVQLAMVATIVVLCLVVGLLFALLLRNTRRLHLAEQQWMGTLQAEQQQSAGKLQAEQQQSTKELQAAQQQAEKSAAKAEQLETQLQDLVSGRLPRPLRPMRIDTLIDLEQAPLRSLLFTQVGTAEAPGYEYKMICRNDGPESFVPRLRILLFSDAGVQTGSANLSDSADVTRLGTAGMAAGESGSFSGRVTLEFGDAPKYFMIVTLPADGRPPRLLK